MQSSERDQLQSKLAGDVRDYIAAVRGGDPAAEQEALRWVCVSFERLLGSLLVEVDGWCGWVDSIDPAFDMLPDAVTVKDDVELTIRGRALWGEQARGPLWIEPFLGSIRLSDSRDRVASYDLRFADAHRGLAQFPYDKHVRRMDWFSPAEWLFVFRAPELF